jgi:flagellar M-ring protein FliF
MERLNLVGNRARQLVAGFTPGQRGVVVVAVLALILGTVALSKWAAQPSWTPLFTGLSATDTSAVVEQLKSSNVPYQLTNGGNTIMVPQAQVYDLRVSMAGKGLTNSTDSSSWSVLDKQGMTSTDFQQNIAYQRAMEGELNRTLQSISGVKTAIVHLAIPKKDVFTSSAEHPTASVLLSLAPGTQLGRSQIRAVMRLVSGSVPGLDASDVTVTDAEGNLLSVREDGQEGAASAASDADHQTQLFEDAKSAAAQKMLDSVLGPHKSVVRVNAELNYDDTETTTQTYQTQTAPPLVEMTSSESYSGAPGGAGGALGQTYPSLTPGVGYGAGAGVYVNGKRTATNAVGSTVEKKKSAPGGVKRMTVAVVLDSAAAAALQQPEVQSLISNAVGLDTARGDTVQVSKIAFDTAAAETAKKELAAAQSAERTAQYVDLGKKVALALGVLIVLLLLRRRGRRMDAAAHVDAVASDLPGGVLGGGPAGALGAGGAAGLPGHGVLATYEDQLAISQGARELTGNDEILDPTLERELLRDEVAEFVDQQPEEIAIIVQSWLGQKKG